MQRVYGTLGIARTVGPLAALVPRYTRQPVLSRWSSIDPKRCDVVKKDVGRKRGRSARRANPCAPPVEAPDHEYRRDWEARVSGQGNVLFLFSTPRKRRGLRSHELLHLQTQQRLACRSVDLGDEGGGGDREGVADDASEPLVVLILERRVGGLRSAWSLRA
jgi:hypothetical protein